MAQGATCLVCQKKINCKLFAGTYVHDFHTYCYKSLVTWIKEKDCPLSTSFFTGIDLITQSTVITLEITSSKISALLRDLIAEIRFTLLGYGESISQNIIVTGNVQNVTYESMEETDDNIDEISVENPTDVSTEDENTSDGSSFEVEDDDDEDEFEFESFSVDISDTSTQNGYGTSDDVSDYV